MANPVNDKPNKSHQKVDFGTILKRRRRTPQDYVVQQGLLTNKEVKEHLKFLRKTYVVSDEFESKCLTATTSVQPTASVSSPAAVDAVVAVDDDSNKNNNKRKKTSATRSSHDNSGNNKNKGS